MSEPDDQMWREEAEVVMADIKEYVRDVSISTVLPNAGKRIYVNLETFENSKFCIELTARGFRIVGNDYDKTDCESEETYETPYSLLDTVSPKYRDSFGRALQKKLNSLKETESDDGS